MPIPPGFNKYQLVFVMIWLVRIRSREYSCLKIFLFKMNKSIFNSISIKAPGWIDFQRFSNSPCRFSWESTKFNFSNGYYYLQFILQIMSWYYFYSQLAIGFLFLWNLRLDFGPQCHFWSILSIILFIKWFWNYLFFTNYSRIF
jgi:hypothetical protein